ncbi:MAG: type II secretion system F family protein [Firmicutes bacterium]|jgi:type IV pilus assembly protein PilC|nr:type II secretion system F family protein [Bacillota bacterium]
MKATFSYRARDTSGRLTKGNIEAGDESSAFDMLKAQGLFIIGLTRDEKSERVKAITPMGSSRGRLGLVHLSRIARHMSIMMNAGVGLSPALHTLTEQAESTLEREVLGAARVNVDAGMSLARSLADTGAFPPIFLNMVDAGEASGRLDEVLARLASYFDRDYDLRQRVKGAMTYPAVIAVFAVIIVIILLATVVPSFAGVLEESGVDLPWLTRALISIGRFVKARWYVLIGVSALIVLAARYYVGTDEGLYRWDSVVLKLPVVGSFTMKVIIVRFSETLASLVGAGVPILQSLEIVERVVGNQVVALGLEKVRSGVREGAGIAAPLADAGIFPPVVAQMVAIGEESGAIDQVLVKLAEFYEKEVDRGIKSLTSIIEPVLIAVVGLSVGLIVAAVMLPMFEMVQVL